MSADDQKVSETRWITVEAIDPMASLIWAFIVSIVLIMLGVAAAVVTDPEILTPVAVAIGVVILSGFVAPLSYNLFALIGGGITIRIREAEIAQAPMKQCPRCDEEIKLSRSFCPECDYDFD